ncbi:MAG: ATP-binding protein [Tissierellia bacterium]|nr:ATP-binding protein [Tissierellia bacterium]
MANIFTMSIPANSDFIGVIRLCAAGVLSHYSVNIETLEDVKLAISEACIEVVACGGESLELTMEIEDRKMVAKVRGRGSNVLCDLSSEQERELGRLIMQSLMDEVSFESDQVIMFKELS